MSRSEFETRYADSAGAEVTRFSVDPLNVRIDGTWVDVDPTLSGDGAGWAVEQHPLAPSFAPTADGKDTVTVTRGGHDVALSLVGADEGSPEAPSWPWDDFTSLAYRDVLPDADLEYTVTAGSVKEALVLQSAPEATTHSWTWRIDPGDLTPTLNDDDVLEFVDADGAVVMSSPTPIAWDSASDGTDSAREEIVLDASLMRSTGEDWYYRVSADESWLQDSDRVYPVYIDPEVVGTIAKQNSYKSDGGQYLGQQHVGNTKQVEGDRYWRAVVNYAGGAAVGKFIEASDLGITYAGVGSTATQSGNVRVATKWQYDGYSTLLDSYSLGSGTTRTDGTVFPTYIATQFGKNSATNIALMISGAEGSVYSHKRVTTDLWVKYHAHVNPDFVTGTGASPANGATKIALTPTFKSSATAVTGSSLRYSYRIFADPNGAALYTSPESTTSAFRVPDGTLKPGTKYYWRAYVRDAGWDGLLGQSTLRSTGAWSFTTNHVPLPNDVEPLSAFPGSADVSEPQILTEPTPELSVTGLPITDSDSTATMQYEISVTSTANKQVVKSGLIKPHEDGSILWAVPDGTLTEGNTYTWSVASSDGTDTNRNHTWTRSFTFVRPDPQITSPVAGSVLGSNLPSVEGFGHPGATVNVSVGETEFCAATVAEDATWGCLFETPLPDGPAVLLAKEVFAETTTLLSVAVTVAAPKVAVTCPAPYADGSWTNVLPAADVVCTVTVDAAGLSDVTVGNFHNGSALGEPLPAAGVSSYNVTVANDRGWHEISIVPNSTHGATASTTYAFGLNDGAPSDDIAIIQKANPAVFMEVAVSTPGLGDVASKFTSPDGSVITVPMDPADGVAVATPDVFTTDPLTGARERTDGIDSAVGMPLANEAGEAEPETQGLISYSTNQSTTTIPVVKADGSVQVVTIIRDMNAPKRFEYPLELAPGTHLSQSEGGMVSVVDEEGTWIAGVAPAWATDANGINLPTHYELDGTTLVQVVEHDKNTVYPVVTDPFWIPLIVIALRVAVQVTVKVGSRTVKFAPAAASTVTNALRSFTTLQVRAGAHTFKLDKTAIRHILTRHHPKYWDGTVKTTQTFLNPNMTVAQVKELVHAALKQWTTTLKSRGTGSTFTLNGTVQGVKYTLKIANGRVVQFYPRP